jgi:hypothetical protein
VPQQAVQPDERQTNDQRIIIGYLMVALMPGLFIGANRVATTPAPTSTPKNTNYSSAAGTAADTGAVL